MPLQITKSWIFKKGRTVSQLNTINRCKIRNQCSMLEKREIAECCNNNIIVKKMSENVLLQEWNDLPKKQVNKLTATHEVEKMSRDKIDKCNKLVDEGCKKVLKDCAAQTQSLKEEKHELCINLDDACNLLFADFYQTAVACSVCQSP